MKRFNLIQLVILVLFTGFFSCEKMDDDNAPKSILPSNFKVDIPTSLSATTTKSINTGELTGKEIYSNLRTFIHVGDAGAKAVQDIITAIRTLNINRAVSFSYVSNDDNRVKNIIVTENATFENNTWQYRMDIIDAESVTNSDKGMALQVFWNTNPVKGIAIIKPYNIDRKKHEILKTAMYRVDYSEAKENGYDQEMTIYMSDIPMVSPLQDKYAINSMKMFVGKKGNLVNVFGNTNHPNATLFTTNAGFNWAFVASTDITKNIAASEVGLPPSSLNSTNRDEILNYYSIKNVFTREIKIVWPNLAQALIDAYLVNTGAPGFFNNTGFVQGGLVPNADFTPLTEAIKLLTPYNPSVIANQHIIFAN